MFVKTFLESECLPKLGKFFLFKRINVRINPYKMFVGSVIPNWLMRNRELSSSDKLVYARLAQYAGKDGECFPKQETIADECGMNISTVNTSIKTLIKVGLLEYIKKGQGKTNSYFFLESQLFDFQILDNGKSVNRNMENPLSSNADFRNHSTEENQLRESEKRGEPSLNNEFIKQEKQELMKTADIKKLRRDWEIFAMSINLIDNTYTDDRAIINLLADPLFDFAKIKANITVSKRLRGLGKGNSKADTVSLKAIVENPNFRQQIMDGDFANKEERKPHLFTESFVYNPVVFQREITKNKKFLEKYPTADLTYYHDALESWAKRNSRKSADWVEEAINFMRLDDEKQQLRQMNKKFKIREGYGE